MPRKNNEKQSRRESTNTYVVNPQKSADPPQPQGVNKNEVRSKNNDNSIR